MNQKLKSALEARAEKLGQEYGENNRHLKTSTHFIDGAASTHELILMLADSLYEANEATSSILEDMEHYFDNKCVPTMNEVNQVSVADSKIRLTLAKLYETLGVKE